MLNNFIKASNEYTTSEKSIPAPYIRRSFELDFVPENATLYITTPGFYELYLNGKNITKGPLAPYISNPNQMVCYDTYDVGALLKKGENVIGIILGNGFANQTMNIWSYDKCSFRAPLSVALTLTAEGEGKSFSLDTDESFKVHPSPVIYDMYRNGTSYDARLEIDGWCEGGFDDSAWRNALSANAPLGEIIPCTASPIAVRDELAPISIEKQENFCYCNETRVSDKPLETTYTEGGYLYDFGINTAGVCRLRIKGERGQRITLRHAERLTPDGKFNMNTVILPFKHNPGEYIDNIPLYHKDEYTLRGGEEEIFLPPFTYHGFRYVFVEGITEEQATPELLTYVVFSSKLEKRADFTSSDEVLNKLYEMTVNADLSNFHYFMTDCPHREKNGWTGDASVSAEQVHLTFDTGDNFKLWLHSMTHTQRDDGMLPGVVPTEIYGYEWGNGPMWDSAAINLPFAAYKYDGRLDLFEECADMLAKYLRYIAARRDGRGLIACGLGDWCQPGKDQGVPIKAPLELTDSATTYDIAKKCEFLFTKIGREADAEYARELARELRRDIRAELIDYDTMSAAGNCQTSQCYLIALGIFDESEYERAYARLIEIIKRDGEKLDTGLIGLRYIFEVLILGGDIDLALKLIKRGDGPSYGKMIEVGATALLESLDDSEFNASCNHHFFGDIIRVFTNYIAGLRPNPTLENTKEILFAPIIPTGIDHASAEFSGVKVGWRREGDTIRAYADIPEGFCGRILFRDADEKLNTGHNEFVF